MTLTNSCWITAGGSGTSDFADGAAITGHRDFTAALEDGKTYSYRAETVDRTEWENGSGVYDSGTDTLSRATIHESSNANAKVNFSAAPRVSIQLLAQDIATAAQVRAKNSGLLDLAAVSAGAAAYDFGNWTGTVTPDLGTVLSLAKATLTGNTTLGATSNVKPGYSFVLEITQDATGGRTLAHNTSYWVTANESALSVDTTANALNVLSCTVLSSGKIFVTLTGKKVS